MLTFEPFRIWMAKAKKTANQVAKECGLSQYVATKIRNDIFPVRTDIIEKLCRKYGLRVEDVIEYRKEE